jgi:hypothetical protein
VELNDLLNKVKWRIGNTGKFKVKDLFLQLRYEGSCPHKSLWNIKIPLQVKIFMWLVFKASILTKDGLLRRGWTHNFHCYLCDHNETVNHPLFGCSLTKVIWQTILCTFWFGRATWELYWSDGRLDKHFLCIPKKMVLCGGAAVCWTV